MDKKEDFISGLEWQLEVEEEGIRALEQKGAAKELIDEARLNRSRTANLVNSFGGPLARKKEKVNCVFVKKGGGWFRGDE